MKTADLSDASAHSAAHAAAHSAAHSSFFVCARCLVLRPVQTLALRATVVGALALGALQELVVAAGLVLCLAVEAVKALDARAVGPAGPF